MSRDYISIAGIIMSRAGDTLHVTDTIIVPQHKGYQRGGMQTHVFYYMILVTWIRRDMHWDMTASNNRDSKGVVCKPMCFTT